MMGSTPAIRAKIDGKDALLALDTGSFELRLDPAFVRRVGILKDLQAGPSPKVRLEVGGYALPAFPALVEPVNGDRGEVADKYEDDADGIIGLDFLRRFAMGLDLVRRRVALWEGGRLSEADVKFWMAHRASIADKTVRWKPETGAPAHITLPLLCRDESTDWYHLASTVGGQPIALMVDTGSTYCSLARRLATALGVKVLGEADVEVIGDIRPHDVGVAPAMTFGPLAIDYPLVLVDDDTAGAEGILGMEALGMGRFLIDMPGRVLHAARANAPRHNQLVRLLDDAGLMAFRARPSKMLVVAKADGRAAKAGIVTGDEVMAINGTETAAIFRVTATEKLTPEQSRAVLQLGLRILAGKLDLKVRKADGRTVDLKLGKG